MVFEHIEQLKRAFTDKYVVVDAARPELARFKDAVGLVKTVNMSGRALVEFDQFDNIGWYDIELDFLKVVPKPEPKLAEAKQDAAKKAMTQPGTEKVTAPSAGKAVVAKAKAAAAPAATGGKPSTADILAAARTKKGAAPVEKSAAAKPAPAAKPAAAPGKKLSTAEILAAARGGSPAAAAPASAPAPAKPAAAPQPQAEEEGAAAEPVATAPKPPPAKPAAKPAGPLPTTTAEKIEYCRRVDAKA